MTPNIDMFDNVLDLYINKVGSSKNLAISNEISVEDIVESLEHLLNDRVGSKIVDVKILDAVNLRFRYLKQVHANNDVELDKVNKLEKDVYLAVLDTISTYYDFGINLSNTDQLFDNLKPLVEDVYTFFVEDFDFNIVTLFHSYIITNEVEIAGKFSLDMNGKDFTISSLKKKFDKDAIAVSAIYHVDKIIDMAISEFREDPDLMLGYITEYDSGEITFDRMNTIFRIRDIEDDEEIPKGVLHDSFVDRFLHPITNQDKRNSLKSKIELALVESYMPAGI